MENVYIVKAAGFIAAALAMGIGSIAPAFGQGLVGAKACENIGKNPESARDTKTTMLMALAVIETSAIYALLIALGILYLTYIV